MRQWARSPATDPRACLALKRNTMAKFLALACGENERTVSLDAMVPMEAGDIVTALFSGGVVVAEWPSATLSPYGDSFSELSVRKVAWFRSICVRVHDNSCMMRYRCPNNDWTPCWKIDLDFVQGEERLKMEIETTIYVINVLNCPADVRYKSLRLFLLLMLTCSFLKLYWHAHIQDQLYNCFRKSTMSSGVNSSIDLNIVEVMNVFYSSRCM